MVNSYMAKWLTIEDITSYKLSSDLSDKVWELVSNWDIFNKKTLGDQFVRAIDSIAGNIAEGFGRFHKKDKIKFYYNVRASVLESIHWVKKSYNRNLITNQQQKDIIDVLERLPREINSLIRITEIKLLK